jgi:pantoate--beta-alanine ligase
MRIIKNPKEMFAYAFKMKSRGKTTGFVPTMGYLHEGHLSLVEAAKAKSDIVVVSIFVNPIQFGLGEDFARYPRNIRKDKKMLCNLDVDILFLPPADKLFDQGHQSYIDVAGLSNKMCGLSRPGHFRGVTTIVAKLFNIVIPDLAFFGEKDFQQLVIIKKMVKDLNFPIEIVGCPIVREYDGLAMSSRNKYLTAKEREQAAVLYRSLKLAQEEIRRGEKNPKKIISRMRSLIRTVPKIKIDYIIIADPQTLDEVKSVKGKVLIALAAYLGKARLIDNMVVEARWAGKVLPLLKR